VSLVGTNVIQINWTNQIKWIFCLSTGVNIFLKHLATNLRYLREQRKLKQHEIEAVLGIRKTTWNNYENGVSKPGLEDFIAISKWFGVLETDLLHSDLTKRGNLILAEELYQKYKKGNLRGKGIGNLFEASEVNFALNDGPANYSKEIGEKDKLIADLKDQVKQLKASLDALQKPKNRKK
jgi:transcriptional regulator with XRE-family HTH domain